MAQPFVGSCTHCDPCYQGRVSAPAYSLIPLDTLEAARDQQDRIGRFALALLVIAVVTGVASMQCLAKDRAARPASVSALAAALLASQNAPRYDKGAAASRWQQRGAKLRAGATRAATGSPSAMAIDWRDRRNGMASAR